MKMLPSWQLNPRRHLTNCPIFGIHYYAVTTDAKSYKIIDGDIDKNTFEGWRTYNGGGCHGRGGAGGVATNLAESVVIKNDDKEKFKDYVINGYPGSLMKPHRNDERVMKNLDNLYNYLKARADGVLGPENLIKNPPGKKEWDLINLKIRTN